MTQCAKKCETGFDLGQEDWAEAADVAAACASFAPDVEEEQVADEPTSCYNCRYRRWTARSFHCMAAFSALSGMARG